MKIQITQEDIDKGEIMDSNRCPIACAFKRLGYTDVRVEARRIYPYGYTLNVNDDVIYKFIDMPPEGHAFVLKFDEREVVEPFEMEVEIP